MSAPPTIWHLEWREELRGRDQERRYRKPLRCADQLASILAAPDDEVVLKGLWQTAGWETNRILWDELDPAVFLEEAAAAQDIESDPEGLTVQERYRLIAAAWREHRDREAPCPNR